MHALLTDVTAALGVLASARRLVHLVAAAVLTLTGVWAHAADSEDLTALPFEQLLQAEVVSASSSARNITDAASAVSVLTRRDIQEHGARTLAEVLDLMRGIHLSYDGRYGYLGARGIGGTRTLAGRVMLFIDGVPAVDNLFDQLYLVHDSLIDVALIERIEYAPGSGSALYGNNAFLGVINVITRRGRDLDGSQFATLADSWGERGVRASWGRRLSDEAELLLSTTLRRGITTPSADTGRACVDFECDGRSEQILLKGRFGRWRAQAMASQIETVESNEDFRWRSLDRSTLLGIGHDGEPAEHWHSSLGLTLGRYAYRARSETPYPADLVLTRDDGGWWVLDGKFVFSGWTDQRIALALQARQDPVMRFVDEFTDPDDGTPQVMRTDVQRRATSASVEHELRWSPQWRSTLGLRADHRTDIPWTWSPRAALVWDPDASWSLKLSHGRASRFASASERVFSYTDIRPVETVATTELVGEYRRDDLRLLSSLYRFRADPTISEVDVQEGLRGRGLELEAQWDWHGWHLRASQAWQHAEAIGLGDTSDSPRQVSKLLLSAPLAGDRWRLALTLRRTGSYQAAYGEATAGQRTADLTLLAQRLAPSLSARLGVRNLTGARTAYQENYLLGEFSRSKNRQFWLEATWSPQ